MVRNPMDDTDRLLARVKERARGLMPAAVYRRLHDSATECGGGTIVEIGTFHGAATAALALGAGAQVEILTADQLPPRVLEDRSAPEMIAALQETWRSFGVAEQVRFVHGGSEALVAEADPGDVRLLLLDGGGRIEADLALLWDRLSPGALIVIDDIDGALQVERTARAMRVQQKHRLSKLLVERFVAAGMLIEEGRTGSTGWYRKGAASPSADEIRLLALPAYHELVEVEVGSGEFGLARALLRSAARRVPGLRDWYRKVRGD
jgi:predicted O-methyltransferase YrrM